MFVIIENCAFEGNDDGGQDDDGNITGKKVEVRLSDIRRLGIVTLGAMKQYDRIEKFLNFLKIWYLCYFSPDAARKLQTAAPQAYLDRIGSNINNVAQYMHRENKKGFEKICRKFNPSFPGSKR